MMNKRIRQHSGEVWARAGGIKGKQRARKLRSYIYRCKSARKAEGYPPEILKRAMRIKAIRRANRAALITFRLAIILRRVFFATTGLLTATGMFYAVPRTDLSFEGVFAVVIGSFAAGTLFVVNGRMCKRILLLLSCFAGLVILIQIAGFPRPSEYADYMEHLKQVGYLLIFLLCGLWTGILIARVTGTESRGE